MDGLFVRVVCLLGYVLGFTSALTGVALAGETVRVNVASGGVQSTGEVKPVEIPGSVSADGRFVVFVSDASDLVPGDTNRLLCGFGTTCLDVFVYDRVLRITERVSVSSSGAQANGSAGHDASISADGRFVAFYANATNLVQDDRNETTDVFVRDRLLGTTELVSVSTDGTQANDLSSAPVISGDGRFVAFHSGATNLVAGDTNQSIDVFVHDRLLATTERVSVSSSGEQTDLAASSYQPAISYDGRFVAFSSDATNLVADDTNQNPGFYNADVFVRDRVSGTTERVSISSTGEQADSFSEYPSISADGRFVAFRSFASNLVPGPPPLVTPQVLVRDRLLGATERVSELPDGTPANGDSGTFVPPVISANGRFVAFWTSATNLFPPRAGGIVVKDRESGALALADVASDGTPGNFPARKGIGISGDGRFVSFSSDATDLVPGDSNGREDQFLHDLTCGDGMVSETEQCDDGNLIDGDGCDASCTVSSCSGGHSAWSARLSATSVGVLRGHTLVRFAGAFVLPVVPAVAFAPQLTGAQLVIEDLGRPGGNQIVVDLAAPGAVVPPGGRGSGCDARDGWAPRVGGTVQTYLNRSGSADAPSCTPGSAAGLRMLRLRDRRARGGGIEFGARILAPRWDVVGPLRGTITLGADPTAGAVGGCGVARFTAGQCSARAGRSEVSCFGG